MRSQRLNLFSNVLFKADIKSTPKMGTVSILTIKSPKLSLLASHRNVFAIDVPVAFINWVAASYFSLLNG